MNELLNHTFTLGHHSVSVLELVEATTVIVLARIGLVLVRRGLRRARRVSSMDEGKQFIIRRLLTSVVWTLAAMGVLSVLGVDLTALWAGSCTPWGWNRLGLFQRRDQRVCPFV